jgi:hypothetical protein
MSRSILLTVPICGLVLGSLACPPAPPEKESRTATVYRVTGHGLSAEEATRLGEAFGVPALAPDEHGAARFTDPEAFLALPMTAQRAATGQDEDEGPFVHEAFALEAIREIQVPDLESATRVAAEALRAADLTPPSATPLATHTRFELVTTEGERLADQAIETAVSYRFALGDAPLEGPGADLRVGLGAESRVHQLSYALRRLEPAGEIAIVDDAGARERCATWTTREQGGGARITAATLAYYAPPLSERIDRLEPSFRCESAYEDGVAGQIYFVPAAADAAPPRLPEPPQPEKPPAQDGAAAAPAPAPVPAAFGRRDVGSEGTGPCSGLPHTALNVASFNNRMTADGVVVQFTWLDALAWENDWKDPSKAGADSTWVDDVDMAYWQGHGSPNGFSFSGCSAIDDASMSKDDALWGNRNVEWVSLFTCLILAEESGGQRWWQRWGPAFDRLHQINSFDTVSYHSSVHGGIYANYLLRANPMTVRQAWAQASIDDQPASVVWATMGVIGSGSLTNWNDHFWGKGGVGPDVPAAQIGGWWRVSGGS